MFSLQINSSKSLSKANEELYSTTSDATRVEILISIDECRTYIKPDPSGKQIYVPPLLFSDILLTLFEAFPSMKNLYIEGYQLYYQSHMYMVHTPATHGIFHQFQTYLDEFRATGDVGPITQFQNIETMEFKRCLLNEHDLEVLGSSMFGKLQEVKITDCTPTDPDVREKYRDFIPNCDWDDKYCCFESERGLKNEGFYKG